MTEGNDQGSKSTIEGLQQSIKLGRERLAQARELKLTQSEIRQINQEEMRLRTDILRVKSEDLELSKAERDQARLKLAEREKELENLREQTAEIERQKGLQDDILDSIGSFGGKFQKSFIDKLLKDFALNIGFYNKPIDPAVKPTTRKKQNSNKSLGKEFTNKLI